MSPQRKRREQHPGRGGDPVSLHPLEPEQALADLLRVTPLTEKKKRKGKPERKDPPAKETD